MASRAFTIVAFRWLVAGCQAATLLITWPLWQVHQSPPMLPALPLPQLDLGVPLLLSLALTLVRPLPGVALHTALLVYAALIDQTRLQPEFVSLAFLLWGSLPSTVAQTFGRAHLVSLWLFAGLNKLFSPTFMGWPSRWLLEGLVANPPPLLRDNVGYLIALTELGLGVLALIPRTRKLAAVAALVVHAGILLVLSPLGRDYNHAVWPWNVALAVAGFALIAPWKEAPLRTLARCHRLARPLIVLLVIAPVGFYVAVTDAYLAHNVYSFNVPRVVWCTRAGRCTNDPQSLATMRAFNVPMPPEHRLIEAYFARTCRPGDRITIRDTRWWAAHRGFDHRELACPAGP